jgi:autotransporter-associated beta strand protein
LRAPGKTKPLRSPNFFRLAGRLGLIQLLLIFIFQTAFAGSATWDVNPSTGDWNTAANWTPDTVPNGPTDVATFATSNRSDVSLSDDIEVSEIVFNPGASTFSITATTLKILTISGAGIINNSGVEQQFIADQNDLSNVGTGFVFTNSASAGSGTVFTLLGGVDYDYGNGGRIDFLDTSSADHGGFEIFGSHPGYASAGEVNFLTGSTAANATFILHGGDCDTCDPGFLSFGPGTSGGDASIRNGGYVTFFGGGGNCRIVNEKGGSTSFQFSGSAEHATILNEAGSFPGNLRTGSTGFYDDATADNATIICAGGNGEGAAGASIVFEGYNGTPTAGNARLVAYGGVNGGTGAQIQFNQAGDGGTARFEVYGNGALDITTHDVGLTIGSLEGEGSVLLGANSLTVGSNNRNATFAGVIQGLGGLTKIGTGTLTLSGSNTYTGGTTVSAGTLLVMSRGASGTGTYWCSASQCWHARRHGENFRPGDPRNRERLGRIFVSRDYSHRHAYHPEKGDIQLRLDLQLPATDEQRESR